MNVMLDKARKVITRLPDAEQEQIERELLAALAADARWDTLFADPRSKATLHRLAAEARNDIARGDVS